MIWGDCLGVMPGIPSESIDMMATDPPYGISFMGKDWDKALPSVEVWKECYRVLKSGSWAFVMSLPRQDLLSRMILNLEEAGFDINYSPLFWIFATGFPKSANVSKMIDKRMGCNRDKVSGGCGTDGNVYGTFTPNEAISNEAKALDGSYIGFQPKPAAECILTAYKPISDKYRRSDVYRILRGKRDYWYTSYKEITDKNRDDQEKRWGFYLKPGDVVETKLALNPALEDETIINRRWVMKSKSYKDTDLTSGVTQALATGKGITWLDGGRIPYDGDDRPSNSTFGGSSGLGEKIRGHKYEPSTIGRFPANLLVSNDMLNDGKVRSSGNGIEGSGGISKPMVYGKYKSSSMGRLIGDSGSFSRYFDLDKWAEANLPDSVKRTFPFLIVPKASKSEKNAGLDGLKAKPIQGRDVGQDKRNVPYKQRTTPVKNNHPTVKPIRLMSYLIAIGSRTGDVILDPFAGSGTTGVAAIRTNRHFIGIEKDARYCLLARNRIRKEIESGG